jgi:hypothetical protein
MLKALIRYWLMRYRRWQYVRTPRRVFEPTVTPIHRTWTDTDERLERELYLANPHAVWLRPDRNDHKVPCWQIEGFWEAPQHQPSLGRMGIEIQSHANAASVFFNNTFRNCTFEFTPPCQPQLPKP